MSSVATIVERSEPVRTLLTFQGSERPDDTQGPAEDDLLDPVQDMDISPVLRQRYSPRAYAHEMVSQTTLRRIFEAARWAPSTSNNQPWRFIVATREHKDEYTGLFSTITGNCAVWAQHAPVLILAAAKQSKDRGGALNRFAAYDVGQAVAYLTIQAIEEGVYLRQIGQFSRRRARSILRIPEGFEPITLIALGYPDVPETLPSPFYERERAPRTRKPLHDIVFDGSWGSHRQ